ncbi:MAG: transporter substrate-binding domain-containing protein [Eubacteriales bacterium]|nr:transporter substrate-binding domain-containing protein [Eubacteriales bacterium]
MKRRMMGSALALTMACSMLAGIAANAAESNLLEEIKEKGTIVVGTSATNAPWESIDEDGNYVGYDMDLINEIASRMGVEVEIQDMAFDALVAAVQTGKVNVAIASMGAKEERKEKVDFTQMYHQQMNVYIAQKGSDIEITDMGDIVNYNVGVQSGTLPDQFITEQVDNGLMKESQVSRYEAPENMILDLEAGRTDVVAGDKNQAKDYEKKYNVEIIFECSFYGTGENIAVPKEQPELLEELDSIIDDLREEGFLDELAAKWEVD